MKTPKKELLIVVQDQHEIKLLAGSDLLKRFCEKHRVSMASPFLKNRDFVQLVEEKWPNIIMLDLALCYEKVHVLDKFAYMCRQFLYFASVAAFSESARQKLLTSLGADTQKLFRGVYFPIRSLIVRMICSVQPRFRNVGHKRNLFQNTKKYDFLIFLRPDSTLNIGALKVFGSSATKVVTLCRNLDTPYLKGVYAVDSDLTICYDEFMRDSLKFIPNAGRKFRIPNPILGYTSGVKPSRGAFSILIVSIPDRFVRDQTKIFDTIITDLKLLGQEFSVAIKPHTENPEGSFSSLTHKFPGLVRILKSNESEFIEEKKYAIEVQGLESIKRHFDMICRSHLVLSIGSTINYEAHVLGTPSMFINYTHEKTATFSVMYAREHLRYLVDILNIPLVSDRTEFKNYVLEAMRCK